MQDGVPERTCPHISGHDRGHTHHHIPARYLDRYLPDFGSGEIGSAPTPDGSGSMQLRLHTLNFFILSIKKVNY